MPKPSKQTKASCRAALRRGANIRWNMASGTRSVGSRPTASSSFGADHDQQVADELRFVQLTPPGSACSIAIGTGRTEMQPGSIEGLFMVVADVQAARDELIQRGTEVSEIDVQAWGSFVSFSDPDGNSWVLQQLPDRG